MEAAGEPPAFCSSSDFDSHFLADTASQRWQAKLKKAVQRGKAIQAERDALHSQLTAAAAERDGATAEAAEAEAALLASRDAAEKRAAELQAEVAHLRSAMQAAEAERDDLQRRETTLLEVSGNASAQVLRACGPRSAQSLHV